MTKDLPRYNIVIGVNIKIDKDKVTEEQLKKVLSNNGLMISTLFPDDDRHGVSVNTCFISSVYQESHRVTYDLVGRHRPTTDMIMESNSDKECIEKHFQRTIKEFLGDVQHEYQIFSLDTLVCEGDNG